MACEGVKVVLGGGMNCSAATTVAMGTRYAGFYARIPRAIRRYGIGPLLQLIPDGRWYKSAAHQVKWLHRLSFLGGAADTERSAT